MPTALEMPATNPHRRPAIVLPAPPARILIIKPSALGDVVHTLPILRLLRRQFPGAAIDWVVDHAFAGLIEGHPDLNEVIRFERRRYARGLTDSEARRAFLAFAGELRRRAFDLVVDLQGLFRSGWMAWQTRAAVRVGFANAREFAPAFYTHRVPVPNVEVHALDRYLSVAEALGCPGGPVEFDFGIGDADRAAAGELLATVGGPRLAVLLPGTNWPTKRWPAVHFAALVGPLRERYGLACVVAGGPGDRPLGEQIPGALNLAGQTTLKQLVAVLERADLVIANDTGPMHVAAALGRPLVTLFGPTNPVRTGPYLRDDAVLRLRMPCSPCYARACTHNSCMAWLTPEMVLRRVAGTLSAA